MLALLSVVIVACTPSPTRIPARAAAQMLDPTVVGPLTHDLANPALRGRDEGSEGSAIAREHLVEQLQRCGVRPAGVDNSYLQPIGAGRGTNVLGRIGPKRADGGEGQMLLVSAHYDHQDHGWTVHPGAQDNAAAVAALLHVACALAQDPPAREVLIAFWDAEEPPTFLTDAMGSRWWHAHPTVPLDHIGAAIVLDLLGAGLWDGYRGTFALGSESSPALRQALTAVGSEPDAPVHVASLSLVEEMVVGPRMVWSDYEVFRANETPVLFVSDGQNARYHTAEDTADALDMRKLAAEAHWLHRLTRHLAEGPEIRWSPAADPAGDLAAVQSLLTDATALSTPWSDTARDALQASLSDLNGTPRPSTRQVRAAAQRLMCWAGPHASMFTCGLL